MAAPGKNTAVLDSVTAPLRKYLDDANVTELVINVPGEVGIERRGGWTWESEPALDYKSLMALATAAAAYTAQDINRENPIVSTIFPTGERVQIIVPPVVPDETVSITVRKPSTVTLTLADFETAGLFAHTRIAEKAVTMVERDLLALLRDGRHVDFFTAAVEARLNILISGGTGSGKPGASRRRALRDRTRITPPRISQRLGHRRWPQARQVSDLRRLRICHRRSANALGKRRGHRHPEPAHLAGLGGRPRREARELTTSRRGSAALTGRMSSCPIRPTVRAGRRATIRSPISTAPIPTM